MIKYKNQLVPNFAMSPDEMITPTLPSVSATI